MDSSYLEKTFQFQEDSDKSMHEQLFQYFEHLIKSGELREGDALIPETEICGILGVSRTTVRQAIAKLVEEGLVKRVRGQGSFVTKKKMDRRISSLYNFTENMRQLGKTPSSAVLYAGVDFADNAIRLRLNLPRTQEYVFRLNRIRLADSQPVLIENTCIPYYMCEGIERNDFSRESLYRVLEEQYALKLYHATETIEAVLITDAEAELLKCPAGSLGYRITRVSHLDTGFVFEYTSSITRADQCRFQLELYKDSKSSRDQTDIIRSAALK